MRRSHYAALAKIVKNIATELDEMSLVVDSMSDDPLSEDVDNHYLKINDSWHWFYSWLDEQEITDEN